MLSDEKKQKLMALIDQAEANGESPEFIQNELIPAFKQKHDTPEQSTAQPAMNQSQLSSTITDEQKKAGGLFASAFPKTFEAQMNDKPYLQQVGSAIGDVFSLPARAVTSAATFAGAKAGGASNQQATEMYQEDLSKRKSDMGGVSGFIEDVVEDPALIPSLAIGGPAASVGKSALANAGKAALFGLAEGATSAAVHQAERYGETGKINLGEAALEAGVSTLFPLAVSGASALKKTVATKVDNIAGRIAEWATGVDEEALRMAGTKEGKQTLKSAFGKQAEIGAELVDVIDDAYNYMPDYKNIDNALKQTPAVNVVPMIKKLEDAAGNPTTAEMKAVSEKILTKAEEMRNLAVNSGNSGYVNATDLIAYRKELDDIIGDSWGKESGKYVNALKNIRHDIKEEVLKNATGTEYEKTMKEFAEKLDALDKIKKLVGNTAESRELRAESFIRNINNKGKEKAREWLTDFEKVFGGDFVQKSKLTRFAEMMGDEGSGSWLPRWTTGRSNFGTQAVGIAVGSPKIASRVTLPATNKLTRPSGLSGVANNKLTRQAVRTTINEMSQD